MSKVRGKPMTGQQIIRTLARIVHAFEREEAEFNALPEAERKRIIEQHNRDTAEQRARTATDQALGIERTYAPEKHADPDAELRLEVCEALQKEGKAPHVAANLTNTTAKLLEQARRLQLI